MLQSNIIVSDDQMGNTFGHIGSPRVPNSKKNSMSPSIFENTHTKLF